MRPDEETLRLWSGISVYDTFTRARKRAIGFTNLGNHVAELRLAVDDEVRWERTTHGRGHYTVWGDPDLLLARVVAVWPVIDPREVPKGMPR